jgi:hypothetical protein
MMMGQVSFPLQHPQQHPQQQQQQQQQQPVVMYLPAQPAVMAAGQAAGMMLPAGVYAPPGLAGNSGPPGVYSTYAAGGVMVGASLPPTGSPLPLSSHQHQLGGALGYPAGSYGFQ